MIVLGMRRRSGACVLRSSRSRDTFPARVNNFFFGVCRILLVPCLTSSMTSFRSAILLAFLPFCLATTPPAIASPVLVPQELQLAAPNLWGGAKVHAGVWSTTSTPVKKVTAVDGKGGAPDTVTYDGKTYQRHADGCYYWSGMVEGANGKPTLSHERMCFKDSGAGYKYKHQTQGKDGAWDTNEEGTVED